jgi:hypothetical protein
MLFATRRNLARAIDFPRPLHYRRARQRLPSRAALFL